MFSYSVALWTYAECCVKVPCTDTDNINPILNGFCSRSGCPDKRTMNVTPAAFDSLELTVRIASLTIDVL